MKSNSHPDKTKALRGLDPLVNDATADYLINSYTNTITRLTSKSGFVFLLKKHVKSAHPVDFKDISSAMNSLSIEGIKAIDKDCRNAEIILKTKYDIPSAPMIDSSIWFLLDQLEFYESSFDMAEWRRKICITNVVDFKMTLRADTNLELLFSRLDNASYDDDLLFTWCSYNIEKSPFKDKQLYAIKYNGKLIGESLLLEDPKVAAKILNENFYADDQGAYNYLLLLNDNPEKLLLKLQSNTIHEMYYRFVFASDVRLRLINIRDVRGMPKKRQVELVGHLIGLKNSRLTLPILDLQSKLQYLNVALLVGGDETSFKMDYARAFAQIPKTLELLGVLEGAELSLRWFGVKCFNKYFLERPKWDEAVKEHFHFFTSQVIIESRKEMTEKLAEYTGIDIQKVPSMLKDWDLSRLGETLDIVSRHLNRYFEIINEQTQGGSIKLSKRLKASIGTVMFGTERVIASCKNHFVHYQLVGRCSSDKYSFRPVFVTLAHMHRSLINSDADYINSFLCFEHTVYNYFSDLTRMDIKKAFKDWGSKIIS